MKPRYCLLAASAALFSLAARADSGICVDDADIEITIEVAGGQITELTVKVPKSPLVRYPEANGRMVTPPMYGLIFSAKETPAHEAIQLDLSGKTGRLKFRGRTSTLECAWN